MQEYYSARTQELTPRDEPRHSVGPPERVRLLDRMNTWKAFLIVLALVLIIDGFLLFYLR
jgi:hypothetical protein